MRKFSIIRATRTERIGSTDIRTIASGKGWLELYRQKVGEAPMPDLSYEWKPQLGLATEDLHAWWHAHTEGVMLDLVHTDKEALHGEGLPAHHTTSVDRFVNLGNGTREVLELKHTYAANDLRGAATFYMPQLQWQMHVLDVERVRFSIIKGNEEPEWAYVDRDQAYIEELVKLVDAFWWHVENKTPPEPDPKEHEGSAGKVASLGATVPVGGLKPYDMAKDNEWADAAYDFIRDKAAADGLKASEKRIRGMIPADAETVTGAGLSFKRDARGAYRVTINPEELAYWQKRFDQIKRVGSEPIETEASGG